VLASIALYVILPARLLVGPRFLVPTLELLLLFVIRISKVHEDQPRGTRRQTVRRAIRHAREPRSRRAACVALLVCVSASNAATLVLLTDSLLQPSGVDGRQLLLGALAVWATNVLSFALWFWEFDRGGPGRRHRVSAPDAIKDFSFPQEEGARPTEWSGPVFVDYLYLAYTNATAFSPTDAMPITPKAKMAMMFQSMISLLTVLLVTARAVNILS
jgi:uncharacterized membrane protein